MTRYARIEQGSVREVVETAGRIEELYHPDLLWVELQGKPEVVPGWVVGPDGFSPPKAEEVLVAPVTDVAELARRVGELQEQLRVPGSGSSDVHPGMA